MNNWWRKKESEKSDYQKELEQGARDLFYFVNEDGLIDVYVDEEDDDAEEE